MVKSRSSEVSSSTSWKEARAGAWNRIRKAGELSVLETKGAVAPNRAVARPKAPRSGADGAAQRR